MEDNETITEDNVEEAIEKALENYKNKNLLIDYFFWNDVISKLKRKIRKEDELEKAYKLRKQNGGKN